MMSDLALLDTVSVMTLQPVEVGQTIMEFGDIGDQFYFIVMGEVDIHTPNPNKLDAFARLQ
jgi:CRP-like cAMP-binding protein